MSECSFNDAKVLSNNQGSPFKLLTCDRSYVRFISEIERMLEKDIADNKAIGEAGCNLILNSPMSTNGGDISVRVLTHCNTGSLATAGYGTALGVIRALHSSRRLGNNRNFCYMLMKPFCQTNCVSEHVYCTETRPYNQGARLTAFELVHDKIPATLICDSAVSALMKSKAIAAVIVGADRVARNGDTANKIGTYQVRPSFEIKNLFFQITRALTDLKTVRIDKSQSLKH